LAVGNQHLAVSTQHFSQLRHAQFGACWYGDNSVQWLTAEC
jgi:hypothetical protein